MKLDFNTSHVTVYLLLSVRLLLFALFQYISCYCLSSLANLIPLAYLISIHLMLLFIDGDATRALMTQKFQYISCYCLSTMFYLSLLNLQISIHLMLLFIFTEARSVLLKILFQYISCYCLSILYGKNIPEDGNFNTSHVTVYRKRNHLRLNTLQHFNTSHVTVYRRCTERKESPTRISIHLMLLFILCT